MSPIRPERLALYPADWPAISAAIREDRAKGHCECEGECGKSHGRSHIVRCKAVNGKAHPVTGARVVLTVAHLDRYPPNVAWTNLRAMCQRCHLAYDAVEHAANASHTRAVKAAAGMDPLFELPTGPQRLQYLRAPGFRIEDGIYVGRGTGAYGQWGNPNRLNRVPQQGWSVTHARSGSTIGTFSAKTAAARFAVDAFRAEALADADYCRRARQHLAGFDLVCWCGLDDPCHADVLLEIANSPVMCTPGERCRPCRNAARCTADGQHAAAHAFQLQARAHHAEVGHTPDPVAAGAAS